MWRALFSSQQCKWKSFIGIIKLRKRSPHPGQFCVIKILNTILNHDTYTKKNLVHESFLSTLFFINYLLTECHWLFSLICRTLLFHPSRKVSISFWLFTLFCPEPIRLPVLLNFYLIGVIEWTQGLQSSFPVDTIFRKKAIVFLI